MAAAKAYPADAEQTLIRKIRGALTRLAHATTARPALDAVEQLLPPLFERNERRVVRRLVDELQTQRKNRAALDAYLDFMDLKLRIAEPPAPRIYGLIVQELYPSNRHNVVLLDRPRAIERSLARFLRLPEGAVRISPQFLDVAATDPDADYLAACAHAASLHAVTPAALPGTLYNTFRVFDGSDDADDAEMDDAPASEAVPVTEPARAAILLVSIQAPAAGPSHDDVQDEIERWAHELTKALPVSYRVGREVHVTYLQPHAAHPPFEALLLGAYLEEQTELENALLDSLGADTDLSVTMTPVAPVGERTTGVRVTIWSNSGNMALNCCAFDHVRNPDLLIERLGDLLETYDIDDIFISKQSMAPTFCRGCGEPHCVDPSGKLTHVHAPQAGDLH